MFFLLYGMPASSSECQHPETWPGSLHLWTFERGVSKNKIFISVEKGEILSYMRKYKQKFGYKVKLISLFNNNIERVAPFSRLYEATRCLNLINNWSHWWLQIAGKMEPPFLRGVSK